MNRLSPWEKIMRARRNRTGLRLTPAEVGRLGMDGAIETAACHEALDAGRCTQCFRKDHAGDCVR